jgi:hypothetical protein
MTWHTLGTFAPRSLVDARVELHWAAQVLSAVGTGWVERRDDDSHTSMEWRQPGVFVGGTNAGTAIALSIANLTLLAVRNDPSASVAGSVTDEFALTGRTLTEALAWADERMATAAGTAPRGLQLPTYDMPDHRVVHGAHFDTPQPALVELADWYANADALLRAAALREPGATPIRCWPHHFDIAAIAYLDPARALPSAPQIGFGLSPGDSSYPEPYFYLTPYPIAVGKELPPLPGGHWHRQGWTGAVLTGSELLESSDPAQHAARFLEQALAACRLAIGATTPA